uniref:Integrase core domain containing protein n=1 Tax=Solanum tuberosum TaxID=4113 RepID=M1DWZ9_SOLTU
MCRDEKQKSAEKKSGVEVYGPHRWSVVHTMDRKWCPSILMSGFGEKGEQKVVGSLKSSHNQLIHITCKSHVVRTTDGAVRMIDSTTKGAVIADLGTSEDGLNVVVEGSEKPDPAAC